MPPRENDRSDRRNAKTNTGHKNHEGRTIWRGPNGGLFVVRNGVRINMSRDAFERHIEHGHDEREDRYMQDRYMQDRYMPDRPMHGLHKGPHRY